MATYPLTNNPDPITGTPLGDTITGTYDAVPAGDTFNDTDILDGSGGIDTLHIDHLVDAAITPPDALWTGVSNIERVEINTTGDGAQTITTGLAFETAFAAAGVDLTTSTIGGGAINLSMNTFTGLATIATTSVAGAQTIVTGLGVAEVTALSAAGALDIKGIGLTTVTATNTGAGSQTIGDVSGNGANLVSVTAQSSAGAQTINSTSTNTVTIDATSDSGTQTITTGAGDDVITATTTADINTITAGAGDDTINVLAAASGSYLINGDDGNDRLSGGAGIDALNGGAGNDMLFGRGGADSMTGGDGADHYFVRDADDVVVESNPDAGTGGIDKLFSWLSAYTLGDNVEHGQVMSLGGAALTGNTLANNLYGKVGNDSLAGGTGKDKLNGGGGDDVLTGGSGRDILTGGAGNDTFDFNHLYEIGTSPTTRDVITDFASGQDMIDLSTLDANTATIANDAFTGFIASGASFTAAGQLMLQNGVLYGNTDADSTAEFAIRLTGITVLTTSDFVL
jgi:Ca2+-binding RTX toxin-like protein